MRQGSQKSKAFTPRQQRSLKRWCWSTDDQRQVAASWLIHWPGNKSSCCWNRLSKWAKLNLWTQNLTLKFHNANNRGLWQAIATTIFTRSQVSSKSGIITMVTTYTRARDGSVDESTNQDWKRLKLGFSQLLQPHSKRERLSLWRFRHQIWISELYLLASKLI